MVDLLKNNIKPGKTAIDIGCGADGRILHYMALETCQTTEAVKDVGDAKVVGIDRVPSRIENVYNFFTKNIKDIEVLKRIVLTPGDGVSDWNPGSPFDAIRINFALPSLDCKEMEILKKQLKNGGRLVVPVFEKQSDNGKLKLIICDKIKGNEFLIKESDHGVIQNDPKYFDGKKIGLMKKGLEIENENADDKAKRLAREKRKEDVKRELDKWKQDFEHTNKRKPTRNDLISDTTARSLFEQFTKL